METQPEPKKETLNKDPREALLERVERDFRDHQPNTDQVERYSLIRDHARKLARIMVENCPVSRELSLALTSLEAAVTNTRAAIARNE